MDLKYWYQKYLKEFIKLDLLIVTKIKNKKMITTAIFTVLNAYLDSRKIRRHEYIDHFWRTVIWFFTCLIPYIVINETSEQHSLFMVYSTIYMICFRIGVYDFALNLFRGLDFWYTSDTTSSKIDQWYRRNNIDQNMIRITFLIITLVWTVLNIYNYF